MNHKNLRELIAELFGTFTLVFIGTGAVIVNDTSGGLVTHLGVALSFGLTVLAMIYAIGDVSGCHLNPAVTIGFATCRHFPAWKVPGYVLVQLSGALLASLVLRVMFPLHQTLGATLPTGSNVQSFFMELILTLILMTVILNVSIRGKESGSLAGVAIGAVIAFEALVGGPISGGSMNPARSIAPAIVSGHVEHLWIYICAPLMGAIGSLVIWRSIRGGPEESFTPHCVS